MAIKIDIKSNIIPITIGNLEFEFEKNDKNIKKFYKHWNKALIDIHDINKEFESASEEDSDMAMECLDKLSKVLKSTMDVMLGKGAYDKVYALVDSVDSVSYIFLDMCMGLKKELAVDPLNEITAKYMGK